MMHEREKSDLAVVAVKLANKAERSAAEPVEPRAGTKGNANQHSTCRAQYRVGVSQALERIRQVRRHSPEVGAVCGKAARTDLCGGRSEMSVPTAIASLAMTKARITPAADPWRWRSRQRRFPPVRRRAPGRPRELRAPIPDDRRRRASRRRSTPKSPRSPTP